MKKRIPVLIAVAVLVFALTVIFSSSALLQNTLIRPIFIAVQVIVAVVESLPRLLLWLIFGLIGLQILLRTFYGFLTDVFWNRPPKTVASSETVSGPVERYKIWIEQAGRGEFFQQRLSQLLANMLLKTYRPKQGHSRHELERLLAGTELEDIPPDVRVYLIKGLTEQHSGKPQRKNSEIDYDSLDATLTYIEQELGLSNKAFDATSEEFG